MQPTAASQMHGQKWSLPQHAITFGEALQHLQALAQLRPNNINESEFQLRPLRTSRA